MMTSLLENVNQMSICFLFGWHSTQSFWLGWGPSINDVSNQEGGGVKNWSKLPTDITTKLRIWGKGTLTILLVSILASCYRIGTLAFNHRAVCASHHTVWASWLVYQGISLTKNILLYSLYWGEGGVKISEKLPTSFVDGLLCDKNWLGCRRCYKKEQ